MALSDPDGILASPMTIINRCEESVDIQTIIDIADRNQVGMIISGLPFSMDGSIGRQAEKTQDFIQGLHQHTEIPIEFRDERLSTVSAKQLMQGVRKMGRARHDAIAAALILQGYLDEAR